MKTFEEMMKEQVKKATRPMEMTTFRQEMYDKVLTAMAVVDKAEKDPALTATRAKKVTDDMKKALKDLNAQMMKDSIDALVKIGQTATPATMQADWMEKRFVPQYAIRKKDGKRVIATATAPAEITLADLVTASDDKPATMKADWKKRLHALQFSMQVFFARDPENTDKCGATMTTPTADLVGEVSTLGTPYCIDGKIQTSAKAINNQLVDVFRAILFPENQQQTLDGKTFTVSPARREIGSLSTISTVPQKGAGLAFIPRPEDDFADYFTAYLWNRYHGYDLVLYGKTEAETAEGGEVTAPAPEAPADKPEAPADKPEAPADKPEALFDPKHIEKHPCPCCDKKYASATALAKHLKKVHPDYKPAPEAPAEKPENK